jgi:glycosyltransferase involved in cell wall biosynthesis
MADGDGRPAVAIYRSPIFHAHETFVRDHALGLIRYRPLLVGIEDKGNVPPELAARALLAGAGGLKLRLLGRDRALAERMRAFSPALVHAHFAPDGLLALGLAERLQIPLVTTLHGYDVNRTRRRLVGSGRLTWMRYGLFGRRLRERGQLFLAVSDAILTRALEAGFPADRTVVHHNGVDLDRFRPGESLREPGLILHVGRLVEKKGTALLLRALAELRGKWIEARLVVIGEGPLRPRLEAQAMALGLGRAVTFLGARPAADVAAWMARAWLLAVPSVTAGDGDAEGLPTVIPEAAAAGLPAIGSDHSGIPEAIVDGQTGLVVPEGDAAALAAAIGRLLAEPRLRDAMAKAARTLAEGKFDAKRQAALLEAHYDRLLERPPAPAR